MRSTYLLLGFILFLLSCNKKEIQSEYNGTWNYSDELYGIELILEDGYFIKRSGIDDVIVVTKGKYLVTSNLNRINNTICLIPNIHIYDSGDTLMPPCEFIDVLFRSDSTMDVNYPKGISPNRITLKLLKN